MDISIDTFSSLHETIQSFGKSVMIYRGVSSSQYKLIPKIGRYKHNRKITRADNEKKMLAIFKERSANLLDFKPENDFEWLAIAQHHGLPTRLLDWSRNPLVAAYFAARENPHMDSIIYAYANPKAINVGESPSPFSVYDVVIYHPINVTQRITSQSGLFTIHPNPDEPFDSNSITRLVIAKNFKKEMRAILYKYGIHQAALFPDLDGISGYIEWLCTVKEST